MWKHTFCLDFMSNNRVLFKRGEALPRPTRTMRDPTMYSNRIHKLASLFQGQANTSKHKSPSCAKIVLPNLLQLAPSLPAQETDQIGLQLARGSMCQQWQRSRPIAAIHRRSVTYNHDNCHCGDGGPPRFTHSWAACAMWQWSTNSYGCAYMALQLTWKLFNFIPVAMALLSPVRLILPRHVLLWSCSCVVGGCIAHYALVCIVETFLVYPPWN